MARRSTVLLLSQIELWPFSCAHRLCRVVVACLCCRHWLRVTHQPDVEGSLQAAGGLCV